MSKTDSDCVIFWFRRDLRLEDNIGLMEALESNLPVLCIFIFDEEILEELDRNDARINFIHARLELIHAQLQKHNSGLLCLHGQPIKQIEKLIQQYSIQAIFTNRDYEPYARKRDQAINDLLISKGIDFRTFKDQVIFEPHEILKANGEPYTVFTPYKNAWSSKYKIQQPRSISSGFFKSLKCKIPSLEKLGFICDNRVVESYTLDRIENYSEERNIPSLNSTSHLSPHLRFGTVSIRQVIIMLGKAHTTFLNELIWREFFMQILYHFLHTVDKSFRPVYDKILWKNDPDQFQLWCEGKTGYPLVDAGMRQLAATGVMHNRVRMVTASFLCKHLLIDWRWGEAWFARHLLDFDLSANVGNWQWAAGSGCDAAPYFRIFNPMEQQRRFDPNFEYIRQWVPEFGTPNYPSPMVDHTEARNRALQHYKTALNQA